MKTEHLIIIAALAAAGYFFFRTKLAEAGTSKTSYIPSSSGAQLPTSNQTSSGISYKTDDFSLSVPADFLSSVGQGIQNIFGSKN